MPTTGFFGMALELHNDDHAARSSSFIDMGMHEDGCFPSIAAAIIDNGLTRPRSNRVLLTRLLERQARDFPLAGSEGRITPVEQLQEWVNNPERLANCVRALAYTLRQMAVDTLLAYPECHRYRRIFSEDNDQCSPAQLRQPGKRIHRNILAVLADALNIAITVLVVETGKEGHMRLRYRPDVIAGDRIILQLQQERDHYAPKIMQIAPFKTLSSHTTPMVLPAAIEPLVSDPPLSMILARINAADQRLIKCYENNWHRLAAMVVAGEVGKDKLLTIYIKGMEEVNHLNGMGIEHGSQHFFEDILHNTHCSVQVGVPMTGCHEAQLTNELVKALSREMSLGYLDPHRVFAQIDNDENTVVSICRQQHIGG